MYNLYISGISPAHDLYIEEGKPWEMFCVLNTSHPDGQGGSWRNLSFYIDNKLVEEPDVKMFNETAIRLNINVSSVSPNAPTRDYYGVQCKLNHISFCSYYVYVGCEYFHCFMLLQMQPTQQHKIISPFVHLPTWQILLET